jgi:hypothetical protein
MLKSWIDPEWRLQPSQRLAACLLLGLALSLNPAAAETNASAPPPVPVSPEVRTVLYQMSFSPLRLACPSLPTMMWSCTAIPSGFATSIIACVISMSARAAAGSTDG